MESDTHAVLTYTSQVQKSSTTWGPYTSKDLILESSLTDLNIITAISDTSFDKKELVTSKAVSVTSKTQFKRYEYNWTDQSTYQKFTITDLISRTKSDLFFYFYNSSNSFANSKGAKTESALGYLNLSDFNTTSISYNRFTNTTEADIFKLPDGYLSGYSLEHIILASIVVCIIMVIIVLGNTMVIAAIALDRNLKSESNWFIASLAVSDLLVGLLIMPFSLANELMGYWYFGQILCELWLSTDVLLCTASILNLCLISLDRYWSITRAVSYVRTRTKRRAVIMVTIVWILSMIICFPPLVGWKRPQPVKHGKPLCVLSEEIGYVVYSTMGSFYIPCIVMLVVYCKIYIAARSRARRNLKKRPPVPASGKLLSTTTTTSFSTHVKEATKQPDDLSSDDEPTPVPQMLQDAWSTTCMGVQSNDIILTVKNPNSHFRLIDEKRKLLSEDTDSAAESSMPDGNRLIKQNKCVEDTDSASDGVFMHDKLCVASSACDSENIEPLLEDSHMESDPHEESDRKYNMSDQASQGFDQLVYVGANVSSTSPTEQHEEPKVAGEDKTFKPDRQLNEISIAKKSFLAHRVLRQIGVNRKYSGQNQQAGLDKSKKVTEDTERQKRKLAKARERRATIVLGIIMATFILCWLPFFSVYLLSSVFGFPVPTIVFAIFFWGGYCNSALNPVIYTVFNRDFRHAFIRLICKKTHRLGS